MSTAILQSHLSPFSAPPIPALAPLSLARGNAERVQWLSKIDWQLFGTVTFPSSSVSAATADNTFISYLDAIESAERGRVCAVFGREMESKGGGRVGVHFHYVLTAAKRLDADFVADKWRQLVRTANDPADTCAHVVAYDPAGITLAYVLKMSDGWRGEWGQHNVEYFHPEVATSPTTSRDRRLQRRWQQQMQPAS